MKTILLKNATLYPITSKPIYNSDVLIQDGKIVLIGPNLQPPLRVEVIDCKQRYLFPGFIDVQLENREFNWHPVLKESFDFKRLKKITLLANFYQPENFEQLLSLKGIGPKTIRALSLVSEIIYGAIPSYEDPARYTFAHGGKDCIPYPVNRNIYDETIEILEKGIKKSKISNKEKTAAQNRLIKNFTQI